MDQLQKYKVTTERVINNVLRSTARSFREINEKQMIHIYTVIVSAYKINDESKQCPFICELPRQSRKAKNTNWKGIASQVRQSDVPQGWHIGPNQNSDGKLAARTFAHSNYSASYNKISMEIGHFKMQISLLTRRYVLLLNINTCRWFVLHDVLLMQIVCSADFSGTRSFKQNHNYQQRNRKLSKRIKPILTKRN